MDLSQTGDLRVPLAAEEVVGGDVGAQVAVVVREHRQLEEVLAVALLRDLALQRQFF